MHEKYDKRLMRAENARVRLFNRHGINAQIDEIKRKTTLWDRITIAEPGERVFTGYVVGKYENFCLLEEKEHGYCEAFQWYDIITKRREKNDSRRLNGD